MADIQALADSALRLKQTHPGWGLPVAAKNAVRGIGITFTPDVNRLSGEVVAELRKRSALKRRNRM
ncbi:MAG: hypothetical protein AAB472_02470 [Patescibacteria group bacterium]